MAIHSKGLRQDADAAALYLEEADRLDTSPEALQAFMRELFEKDAAAYGEPSLELLQGIFSGLMLAKSALYQGSILNKNEGMRQSADDVARLAVEAARQYVRKIEKSIG